jgi:hypothetical protein
MNKVINLPKRYSWEYMYKVDGVIFTLEQCPYDNQWKLTGYASQEDLDDLEPFLRTSSELKRHFTSWMKYSFNRADWGI